jgi:hypothetical protein
MNYPITNRLPCSVCGLDAFHHHGWFLVVENRWLDHLKILSWHPLLAAQKDIRSVCCRQHLRTLLAHWLDQASLRLPSDNDRPMPIAGDPGATEPDFDPQSGGRLVGELSVHRDGFSRGWTGSPATLECILDALIPGGNETESYTMEFPHFNPLQRSPSGLALH